MKQKDIMSNKEIAIFSALVVASGYIGGFLFGIIGAAIVGGLVGLITYSIIEKRRKNDK